MIIAPTTLFASIRKTAFSTQMMNIMFYFFGLPSTVIASWLLATVFTAHVELAVAVFAEDDNSFDSGELAQRR